MTPPNKTCGKWTNDVAAAFSIQFHQIAAVDRAGDKVTRHGPEPDPLSDESELSIEFTDSPTRGKA
jgi:hypothetical protein